MEMSKILHIVAKLLYHLFLKVTKLKKKKKNLHFLVLY